MATDIKKIQDGKQLMAQAVEVVNDNDNSVPMTAGDTPSVDGFGRWRTSGTGQRLDVEFIYDKQDDFFDERTNSGAVVHNANTRDLTLSLNDAVGGSYAWMSSYPVPYTPGNSQLVDMTGILDGTDLGTGTAEIFLRSSVFGSAVDEVITQEDWVSNTTGIDWGTAQIFVIDFQSLKVGRIRFCLNQNGVTNLVAEINNDNRRFSGYWQLPNLPVSYRLYNTETETISEIMYGDENNAVGFRYRMPVNASATMKAICCTVKSEGGENLRELAGLSRSIDMLQTSKSVGTTLIPLISIRSRDSYQGLNNLGVTIPKSFYAETSQSIRLVVIYNSVLTGAVWNNVQTLGSAMEYDISATAVTVSPGHIVTSRYIAASSSGGGGGNTNKGSSAGILGKTLLWNRLDGVTGNLTIAAVRTSGSNANVFAGLDWEEIR